MKLNIVPARTGLLWVKLGIKTFLGQPLAMSGLFFMFMAVLSLATLVPFVGAALALALLPAADRRSQKPGLMMASIYRTLLREIASDGFRVLHQRVSLTPLRKFWLAWKVQALGRL